jgi:GYF domain 2
MGIRFRCHLCESPLNVKSELASKRGVCPKCHGKFRIPASSQDYSIELSTSAFVGSSHGEPPSVSVQTTLNQPHVAIKHSSLDKSTESVSRVKSAEKSDRSHGVTAGGPHGRLSKGESGQVKNEAAIQVEAKASSETTTNSGRIVDIDGQTSVKRSGVSQAGSSAILEADIGPFLEKSQELVVEEPFYFVRPPSGGEYGPASKSVLEDWIAQKRVTPDSLICRLGESDWLKAKDVFAVQFIFMKE